MENHINDATHTRKRINMPARMETISEEASEMINRTPSWITKWGNIIMLGVIVAFAIAAVIVQYPDTIESTAVIVSNPFPVKLKCPADGKFSNIYFKDGSSVKSGDAIAEMENPVGYTNILKLKNFVRQVHILLQKPSHIMPEQLNLFVKDMELFSQLHDGNLRKAADKLHSIIFQLDKNDVISASISTHLQQSADTLDNEIKQWEDKFLLTAPFDGKLYYIKPLYDHQSLVQGEEVFGISPTSFQFIGYINITSAQFRKIHEGQKAQISLDDYPSNEYGDLEAKITRVVDIPNIIAQPSAPPQVFYKAYFSLPQKLKTASGLNLTYLPQMTGKARIILKEKNLFTKLFSSIRL